MVKRTKSPLLKSAMALLIVLGSFSMSVGQPGRTDITLAINELMASNSIIAQDPQGQYDDWIEIHNFGPQAIDTGGMYLTDNLEAPTKWRIPVNNPAATVIAPGGYLLIWADNDAADAGLHANFKLHADGEEIGLFDSDGITLIDSITFSNQVADISYGRYPDAGDYWRTFSPPSPGAQNTDAYLGNVAEVEFSHNRGFYVSLFSVTIATETDGTVIYYTLDGSEPYQATARGSFGGTVYDGAISINKTTCLRAKAVKPGFKPSATKTQTFIFLDDVLQQPRSPSGFPSRWGGISADYEMDPDIFQDPRYGDMMRDALLSIPTMSLVMTNDDLFDSSKGIYTNPTNRGVSWERPGSVELIYPDGEQGFQANCGVRIQGGWFRPLSNARKKSFRLFFKGIYGPTKLRYPLFGDGAVDEFDTIVLRGGANDGYTWSAARFTEQYTRDEFGRSLQVATGHAGSHGTFVHLYINGLYWGLYNACERPDHSHSAGYYGGEKENWDAIHSGHERFEVINGDTWAWNQMLSTCRQAGNSNEAYQQLQGSSPDGTPNPAYPNLLDVTNYIDYLIVNLWGGNWDWPWKNWYAARDRSVNSTGFKFYCWDYENTMGNNLGRSPLNKNALNNNFSSAGEPHQSLKQNAEYRMLFADRVHRFFFNDGILTSGPLIERYTAMANEIEMAITTESARWGDQHHSNPLTLEDWYDRDSNYNDGRAGRDWILKYYLPQRSDIVVQQLRNAGLYPNVDAPSFGINGTYRHGGQISQDDTLSMTAPTGTIWYTLDGTDPRSPGASQQKTTVLISENADKGGSTGDWAVSPNVLQYTGPITLSHSADVKARVLSGRTWSALNHAVFAVGPIADNLRVTEIMYNPKDPNEEFIELRNTGAETINLSLVRFADGIDFTFPALDLAAGEHIVAVRDRSAFKAKYGTTVNVTGQYSGVLNNAGERIILEDATGRTVLDFTFEDGWRSLTDGEGFSLTLIDLADPDPNSWDEKDSWRPSAYMGGSPGHDDGGIVPDPGAVVINELLARASDGTSDWIELYNTTDTAVDISGWFLSDSAANLFKYEIADGTLIAPGEYLVLYQDQHFGNADVAGSHEPFALSGNGERLYLSSAQEGVLTGYRDVQDFGASATGVSFGRNYKGSTDNYNFVAMDQNTPGSANSYPKVGPVVISEIMYNPDWPAGGTYTNDQYEYVELCNISTEPVTLYRYDKATAWEFSDGIEFAFDADMPVTMPAGGYLLVVKNPAAFSHRYPTVPAEKILGPYSGSLSNAGEKLELAMPTDQDTRDERVYIRIDRVNYSDGSHPQNAPGSVDLWPGEADGQGKSLTRKVLADYGNDPDNWIVSAPSPGR